jgi:hypothetical protein
VVSLVAINVTCGRLPLGIAIATVGDLGEGVVDVVVECGILPEVELVAITM